MKIRVSKDGQQFGPYTLEQLQDFVRRGDFTTNDPACHDGQSWVTIADVPGFADTPVLSKPRDLLQEVPSAQEPESTQEDFAQEKETTTDKVNGPLRKKNPVRWSIIGSVAALSAALFFWLSDSNGPRQAVEGDLELFSWPIEESNQFRKGATIVVSVTGEVSIIEPVSKDSNSSTKSPDSAKRVAKANDVLVPGVKVHTGSDSEVILLFSNGTLATLGPMSEVLVEAFVQQEFEGSDKKVGELLEEVSPSRMKLNLDFGELVVKTNKLKKESSMVISSPLGIAGVRGTQFRVLAKETSATVSVLSGSVVTLDLEKKVLVLTEETSVNLTMKTVAVEIALSAEDRARIESLNANAKEKTANFNLTELLSSFEQINPKLGLLENETDGLGRSIGWGWQGRAPMPEPRHVYDGTVILEGKIYVMGGHAEGKIFNLLQRYDPETNEWATLAPMSKARRSLASTVLNGKIYAIGGYGTSSVEIYDPKSNSWSPGPSLPTSLDSATAITVNGKILLVGGRTSFQGKDQVLELDPATDQWTPKAPLPMARNAAKLILFQGKIWAIGGSAGTRVDLYDPAKDSWTEGAPLATARHWPVAWLANGKIFVAGGEPHGKNDVTTSQTIETYDFDAKKWISCGTLPEAKNGSAAIVFGRKVFLISGHHEAGPSVKVFSGIADPYPSPLPGDSVSAAIFERHIKSSTLASIYFGKKFVSPEDMLSRTHLGFNDPLIRDLTPVSVLRNLEHLWLDRNQVSDLSPLAGLAKLRELSLVSDSLSNLSPLAKLTNLRRLRLGGKEIKDLSPLATLVNLTELRLEENEVTDFSFLQNLTKLQKLYLWGTAERVTAQVAKIKEFFPEEKIASFVVNVSYQKVKESSKPIEWNWEKKAPVLGERNVEDGIEALDGKIYLIGNRSRSREDGNTAERYDPQTDRWERISPLIFSRTGTAATSLNGRIYAIGGKDYNGTVLESVEIYDPKTNAWTLGTPLPAPIYGARAYSFKGKILLFGGKSADEVVLNQVLAFDPSSKRWAAKAPMPEAREMFGSVEYDGKFWLLGGKTPSGSVTERIDVYDPTSDSWSSGPPMASPVNYPIDGWVSGGKIYCKVGGGHKVDSYDPKTKRFCASGTMPKNIVLCGTAVVGGKIYVVSGRRAKNFVTRDVYSAVLR
jgi:N-acetylneuraminic acid mutarotase